MKLYTTILAGCLLVNIQNTLNALTWRDTYSWALPTQEVAVFSEKYAAAPDCALEITTQKGDISIKPWDQPYVHIEAQKRGTHEEIQNTKIAVDANTQTITLRTTGKRESDTTAQVTYKILVPTHASLSIRAQEGNILIKYCEGPTTVALNKGSLIVKVRTSSPESSLFAEVTQGDITLHTPTSLNANIHAKTLSGSVTSEVYITTVPQTVLWNKETWNHFKKELQGTLGEGGIPITLETTKGSIYLLEP